MKIGTVVRIAEGKNFGFINDGTKDHFFHRQDFNGHWFDLVKDYSTGAKIEVEFEEVASPKGARAGKVSRTRHPNSGR